MESRASRRLTPAMMRSFFKRGLRTNLLNHRERKDRRGRRSEVRAARVSKRLPNSGLQTRKWKTGKHPLADPSSVALGRVDTRGSEATACSRARLCYEFNRRDAEGKQRGKQGGSKSSQDAAPNCSRRSIKVRASNSSGTGRPSLNSSGTRIS
jgi:hypothetical protein